MHMPTQIPYKGAMLIIKSTINATLKADSNITIKVYKENKIGVACGFASSEYQSMNPAYVVPTNSTEDFELFIIKDTIKSMTTYNVSHIVRNYTIAGNFSNNATIYR